MSDRRTLNVRCARPVRTSRNLTENRMLQSHDRARIDSCYFALYRAYAALKKSATEGRLRGWPFLAPLLNQIKILVRSGVLPKARVWVRIRSGLSKGMWMQVYLPGEGGLWLGGHEPEVQSAISAVVRPGAVFYDVGAHVGIMTLGTARLVGESGRVVAFDGDPENAERLRVHSERNGFQARVRVVHSAIWSRTLSDGITFRRGEGIRSQGGVDADGNRPVLASGETTVVPAVTLDDFIAAGASPPQLIKIDVEGGEYEVLRGGKKLFTLERPFIIVEVHHQQAADSITAWLDEHQYCAKWEIPVENFPRRLFAWPSEQDGASWMRARVDQNQV